MRRRLVCIPEFALHRHSPPQKKPRGIQKWPGKNETVLASHIPMTTLLKRTPQTQGCPMHPRPGVGHVAPLTNTTQRHFHSLMDCKACAINIKCRLGPFHEFVFFFFHHSVEQQFKSNFWFSPLHWDWSSRSFFLFYFHHQRIERTWVRSEIWFVLGYFTAGAQMGTENEWKMNVIGRPMRSQTMQNESAILWADMFCKWGTQIVLSDWFVGFFIIFTTESETGPLCQWDLLTFYNTNGKKRAVTNPKISNKVSTEKRGYGRFRFITRFAAGVYSRLQHWNSAQGLRMDVKRMCGWMPMHMCAVCFWSWICGCEIRLKREGRRCAPLRSI